ncbi:MAG: hypothetical protein F6K30_00155, partial [Cyanothece sp. SIO2G6]|nr:hypothetical protein [Cyanothece sp. SIO2G6]
MTHVSNHEQQIQAQNDESLRILTRSLTLSQGKFSLMLANCQYRHVRDRVVNQLQHQCDFDIQCFNLPKSAETLYSPIAEFVDQNPPRALMVFGLDQVKKLIAVLKTTNRSREEFRKNFPFPIVLWVNRQVKTAFIRSATDFESWSTTVEFCSPSEDLHAVLVEESDRIFDTLLEVGSGLFLDNRTLGIQPGGSLLVELETASSTLQARGIALDAKLAGSLEFICGRAAVADEERSRQHYKRSIELLRTSDASGSLERLGCVQHHLGVWWRTYSVDHRAEHDAACGQARDCFREAIATFRTAQRLDLVARFTEKLGEVLQRLEDWEGLEQLVAERLELHPTYPDLFREARTCGFRAELALAKAIASSLRDTDIGEVGDAHPTGNLTQVTAGKLAKAKEWALEALQILDDACATEVIPTAFDRDVFIDWHNSFLRGWYRFALGRAHQALGETTEAIQALEQAWDETNEAYDPPLCISILQELRQLYFDQGEYLQAFETRLDYRSIEQQYGYRAFVGAGRLRAKKAIANPGLARVEAIGQVSTEISASGRQQDVERLIGRLQRSDQKLIVLHGQSGVGKSSIIQAGLIPALTPLTVDGREVAVVLQQVYTPWDKQLGDRILETLRDVGEHAAEKVLESSDDILQKLEQTVKRNFMAVLILDQFEEFFFVYKDPTARKLFYQFLHTCLDIPYVKVVLSLREDYLHYLLECNNRLVRLDIINNNILDKDILYYLGNFSPDDAKSVIEGLTGQSQFSMEADLVDALVQDLAQELGEVRPIELQVVGNQLQTEDITTLKGYEEKGPKEALVGRFLEEIVTDCGPDNEQIAKLVLYLLTDENNTRPLKTRADLELELDVESGKLDLILALLVKSRLVFLIPASPDDRYQLVHDYLVPFVREQQSAHLIAEIEKEREQRKLTEARLDDALERQLHTARRAMFTLAGLVLAVTGFSVVATIAGINTYLTAQTTASSTNTELERLVSALRTARNLKRLPGVIEETRLRVLTELNQAISSNTEVVHLEGHTDEITHVDFSPDGQNIVSASKDATIRVWGKDGSRLFSLDSESGGHTDVVNVVRFSPDGQLFVSGSKDKTIKIWQQDGSLLQTLEGHVGGVNDVQFSSDGELIVSASDDQTVRVWNLDGSLIRTFEGHTDRVTKVQFSPDDKIIGSGSEYDIVRLWSLEGGPIGTIESYRTIDIQFRGDNETIVLARSNGDVDVWNYKDQFLLKSKHSGHFTYIYAALSTGGEYSATISRDEEKKSILIRSNHNDDIPWARIAEESGELHYIRFSPDNKYIISSAQDNVIKLRDLQDLFAFPSLEDEANRQVIVRYLQDSNSILIEDD